MQFAGKTGARGRPGAADAVPAAGASMLTPYTADALRPLSRPRSDEADLPAQEEKARQDPRLPRAFAHPIGSGDPPAPAAEGPQAPHPLTLAEEDRFDARPRRRLSRSGDFDRVYRDGDSRGNRFLTLYSFARGDAGASGEARLGVSVGRRIGGAVQRNKVKRAIRESFWKLAGELPAAHDYVIVARPGIEGLVERDGANGVRDSLAELLGSDGGERLS
jgi:ribonuclease P protein component